MMPGHLLGDLLAVMALLVMPFLMIGVINRVKSLWSGRKGQPVWQSVYDVLRLLRKTPVYSSTATPIFRIAPWIFLLTAVASSALVPLLGGRPVASFPYDFVWLAYAWGLGRVAVMLAALDTGSSFEGMGVAREATFSALLEPALFLIVGALRLVSGADSLGAVLLFSHDGPHDYMELLVHGMSVLALMILLQVETARMPVDDPTTHLELTMVHEVMVLDHSGPDLAAIQVGTAIKLFVTASLIAMLLNPLAGDITIGSVAVHLGLCFGIAVLVGTVESLIARLRLRAVPQYIAIAVVAGVVALLATSWRSGGF